MNIEYTVASAGSILRLIEEVNKLTANGWKPLGGVTVAQQLCDNKSSFGGSRCTLYDVGLVFAQALSRETPATVRA